MSQDFGWALAQIQSGHTVQRVAWAAKKISLSLRRPDSEITLPFILLHRSNGETAPWLACPNDLLATDWMLNTANCEHRKD